MNRYSNFHFLRLVGVTTFLVFFNLKGTAQNMYSLSGWTVGTGSITDFAQYGPTSSNSREVGFNHLAEEVILWKATPDPSVFTDGGIYASYKTIDPTKTYRLSVWIKKTNSFSGNTYFGCNSYSSGAHQTLNLDGTADNNPYFWYGDLPELDKWYLLVGYVHPTTYTGVSLGRIYDGETGEEVMSIDDKKFSANSVNLRLRTFFAYDANLQDRQYMYDPLMEEYTGSSMSINDLLGINEESSLVFFYDNSGNQKQRFYCREASCVIPPPPAGKPTVDETLVVFEKKETTNFNEEEFIESKLMLLPNPTHGKFSVNLTTTDYMLSNFVNIYNVNGALVKQIHIKKDIYKLELDITKQPSGIYFIHLHFSNGSSITRKIIKK